MKYLEVYKGYVHLIESLDELNDFFSKIADDSLLTFDWETTGLEYDSTPLGLSMHQKGVSPVFVPIDYFFSKGLPMSKVADVCNRNFARVRLMAHNSKFDSMINVMNGIKDENCHIVYDTLIMVHLFNPEIEKQLEKRVKIDFGYAKPTFEEKLKSVYGEKCKLKWSNINWSVMGDELLDYLAAYAGEDTYWETQLFYKYKDLLDEDSWRVHNKIELPMVRVLRDAKIRGVKIDVPLLEQMLIDVDKRIEETTNKIYEEAGCIFNINSTKQKQEIFFDKLHLPVVTVTKKGANSTDSYSMKVWADMGYPIGKYLLEHSELNKLKSGYLQPIPQLVDSENVLRGDINSCGTATGRCSSSNPNLQNQPNNHDFPIRCAFVPREGYVFINYDYSQLELRVMAHMSKDSKFMDIFLNGGDPHGEVARACGITRKQAKVMNFGVLYGMGYQTYMTNFGVSQEQAIDMIEKYHQTYSGFAKWKEATEKYVQKMGYVKNLFGRKRVLPEAAKDMRDRNKALYFSALRQSVNTIIQGTGADIVKLATIAMCKKFQELNLDAHFLLQVHDEVLIEAREDQMLQIEQVVIDSMENTTKLAVPLLADGKIIRNWGEMKDDNIVSVPFRFDYSLMSSIM